MNVVFQDGGLAIIRIGRKTWIRLGLVLIVAVMGHVKLQWQMNTRLKATEQSVCEFKRDYHETTKELRADIRELTSYLIDKQAKSAQLIEPAFVP